MKYSGLHSKLLVSHRVTNTCSTRSSYLPFNTKICTLRIKLQHSTAAKYTVHYWWPWQTCGKRATDAGMSELHITVLQDFRQVCHASSRHSHTHAAI